MNYGLNIPYLRLQGIRELVTRIHYLFGCDVTEVGDFITHILT